MMKLSDREWREFRLSKLFIFKKGKCSNANELSEGVIPYIGATNRNNGVLKFCSCNNNLISNGNCIVFIGAGDGSAGYSVYKYEKSINSSNNICGYNSHLNKYIGLFISCCSDLNQSKYSHAYSRNLLRLSRDKILLPITPQGEPDYQFMEDYIEELMFRKRQEYIKYVEEKVKDLKIEEEGYNLINRKWKEFKIEELFLLDKDKKQKQVLTGSYINKKFLNIGNIPRITVTSLNNGIDSFWQTKHRNNREYKNFISVSFLGNAFYHKYKASIDMKVHVLKTTDIELSENTAIFFIAALNSNIKDSSYGNQLSSTDLPRKSILLPINQCGEPDYQLMEDYTKSLMYKKYTKYLEYIKNRNHN